MQALTFGSWLRRQRIEQDLTQEMLAEKIGCATPTLRAFESGKRRPSRAMAEHIATILQVPAADQTEFLRLARLVVGAKPEPLMDDRPRASEPSEPVVANRLRLPQALNVLIGREAEGNVLIQLLSEDRCRLVTIVGAGGMGKTRLALDCATALADHFADGVGFVALAALDHAQHLPTTVAQALQLELQGVREPSEQVLNALAQRKLLLVLDNFEHLLSYPESIAWVKAIVQRAPGVQLLITSRERLRISEERSFALSGLALSANVASAEQSDAVILFLARAQQATGNFVLDAHNKSAIMRICALVEGMPLALELAAAWVRVLSCDEIADEIQRSSDFLALADRDMTPRHRSMRAVFDYSWALLTDEERQVLTQLAIFRGGCGREAAQFIAQATLPVLASLIDKSLLRRIQTTTQQGRYDLHELTRQYIVQRLEEDPARQQTVQIRHVDFYARFVEQQQAAFGGAQQMSAIEQIEQEFENIGNAWMLALQQVRIEPLQKMLNGLGEALYWRGRYHEALTLFQAAVTQLTALSEQTLGLQFLICEMCAWLGCFMAQVGNTHKLDALFEDVLIQLAQLAHTGYDVRSCQALTLDCYAYFHAAFSGDYRTAYTFEGQSLELYRQLGDQHQIARALAKQSRTLHFLGQYTEAVAMAKEAIAISQRQEDQLALVDALEGLALSLTYLGKFSEAEPYFRTALTAAEATRQPGELASVLLNLGIVLTFASRFSEGQQVWARAHAISLQLGERNQSAHVTILLGFAALHLGDDEQAQALAQQGIVQSDEIRYMRGIALAKILLGSAQLAQGQLAQAHTTLAESIQYYQTVQHTDELAWALAIQAYILRAQGLSHAAQQVATEAMQYTLAANSFIAIYSLLPVLTLSLFEQGQIALATEAMSTIWQSAFVRHSPWFKQVVGVELNAWLATLPHDNRVRIEAQVTTGDPQDALAVLKQIALLLPAIPAS